MGMHILVRILSAIDTVSKWSGYVIMFLVVVIAIFLSTETVARYIFNAPTLWATESTTIAFGLFALLSGAYVLFVGAFFAAHSGTVLWSLYVLGIVMLYRWELYLKEPSLGGRRRYLLWSSLLTGCQRSETS